MMRAIVLFSLTWCAACGDILEQGSTSLNACELARQMNGEAVEAAGQQAGPCQTDQDCVRVSDAIDCPAVRLGSCGVVMHRLAAEAYAASGVQADICEVTRDAVYGCSAMPVCAGGGDPVCVEGMCR